MLVCAVHLQGQTTSSYSASLLMYRKKKVLDDPCVLRRRSPERLENEKGLEFYFN